MGIYKLHSRVDLLFLPLVVIVKQMIRVKRRELLWGIAVLLGVVGVWMNGCLHPSRLPPEQTTPLHLTSADRVLILAPHEDDEVLGTGGVIQQAVALGAPVRVVYLTYGDSNELAVLFYRKRPWLSPKVNRSVGEARRVESTRAMKHLGVSADQLVFLGFPDRGSLPIWEKHWGTAPPLHSFPTNTNQVPYANASCYAKPHKGEEIATALERQILDFRPTHIFVSHPADANMDHRAYYLFLQLALLDLKDQLPLPQVYAYPTHMGAWPRPLRYHPDQWLSKPKVLAMDASPWYNFDLSDKQVKHKYEAICLHKSQMSDHWYWLSTFARRNELFTSPQPLLLNADGITDAQGKIVYQDQKDGLRLEINLAQTLDEDRGIDLYLFGYRHDVPFAAMPKLHLEWMDGQIHLFDQSKIVSNAPVNITQTREHIIITLPWSLLQQPEKIFANAQPLVGDLAAAKAHWVLLARTAASQ